MLLARLEDAVAAGAPALAWHMNQYIRGVFVDCDREYILDGTIDLLQRSPSWRSNATAERLPRGVLTGFPIGLRNAAAAYQELIAMQTLAVIFTNEAAEGDYIDSVHRRRAKPSSVAPPPRRLGPRSRQGC